MCAEAGRDKVRTIPLGTSHNLWLTCRASTPAPQPPSYTPVVIAHREAKMIPSSGRIVHYQLTESDVEHINARRSLEWKLIRKLVDDFATSVTRVPDYELPMSHGNSISAGDVYPAMIVRVWDGGPGTATEHTSCQLQVFLDGNDTEWVTSRSQSESGGAEFGRWWEPARV